LQVSIGKQIQKRFLPENKQSETLALLIGAFVWTLLLSIPYLWIFALIVLTAAQSRTCSDGALGKRLAKHLSGEILVSEKSAFARCALTILYKNNQTFTGAITSL
jgi:hypothetical protein